MYWRNIWQPTVHVQQYIFDKLLYKLVLRIFTLLLAPFAPKLVNYSMHSDSLKNRREMSSISEFFRMFKDSLCRHWLTNLDAKRAKTSVQMSTTSTTIFYKSFFKNILSYMNIRRSKIRSVRILCPGRFILVESVRMYWPKFPTDR